MRLEKLTLFGFRNYEQAEVSFKGNVISFLGKNGAGKTNLLDAIHYLSFTKSAFSSSDTQNVITGGDQFVIRGEFSVNDHTQVVSCGYQIGGKKTVRLDEKDTKRMADHIGKFPVVLVAPNDMELIWDGSELRRRFFDALISQIDKTYLEKLMVYAHQLRQRNSLLRSFENQSPDYTLLESYDQALIESGKYIAARRQEFVSEFLPDLQANYEYLSGTVGERVDIAYRTDSLGGDLASRLKGALRKDMALQRTTVGVHRDDFIFHLMDHELRRFGSQGQQKSFLIALKLAEFGSIVRHRHEKPLLLLDDIFDKLDNDRIHKLVALVAQDMFGQLFITDARPDRTEGILQEAGVQAEIIRVENGRLLLQ